MNLTPHEQDVMAEICAILSSFIMDDNHEDKALLNLGEDMMMVADKANCSPQFFGRLYDKFHRTGSNQ